MSVADCVFCKIVAGEIPCHRVFENERVLAFLDINPLSLGHTVVIPRAHAVRFEQLSEDDAAALAGAIGPLARRILSAVGSEDYNLLQNNGASAGQVVMHVHIHIIPRRANDGLGFRWKPKPGAPEELSTLASRISA